MPYALRIKHTAAGNQNIERSMTIFDFQIAIYPTASCYPAPMKKVSTGVFFALILSCLVAIAPQNAANAGLFDCIKPKKWSGYSKLRTAYLKDAQLKTEDDWFKAYIFARIFTGSSKCFNSKDVVVMKKFVNAYNQACSGNPSWNYSCKYYSGRSTLASWVYEGYK